MRKTTGLLPAVILMLFIIIDTASAAVAIVSNMTQDKQARPGEIYKASITVKNNGTEPEAIRVYQTDYMSYSNGTTNYGEPAGKMPRSNAGWITFSPKTISVGPDARVNINYEVKVPDDKNLTGSYWSVVMVEQIPKPMKETETKKQTVGLQLLLRYAIQIITDIDDTGLTKINFLNSRVAQKKDGKGFNFFIEIENTGERQIVPEVSIEFFDMKQGKSAGKFTSSKNRIFPSGSTKYTFDLGDIPAGKYKVQVLADCGGENLFGGEYNLDLVK
jgi:hypothetical protein